MNDNETVQVPTTVYAHIGLSALRLQREVQALWDAVYLTHPNKEALLKVYVKRLAELEGGASLMVLETADYTDAAMEQGGPPPHQRKGEE